MKTITGIFVAIAITILSAGAIASTTGPLVSPVYDPIGAPEPVLVPLYDPIGEPQIVCDPITGRCYDQGVVVSEWVTQPSTAYLAPVVASVSADKSDSETASYDPLGSVDPVPSPPSAVVLSSPVIFSSPVAVGPVQYSYTTTDCYSGAVTVTTHSALSHSAFSRTPVRSLASGGVGVLSRIGGNIQARRANRNGLLSRFFARRSGRLSQSSVRMRSGW